MEPRKGRWEDWEKDFLFKHAQHKTDEEMAAELGRTKTSVIEQRRKLNIKKNKKAIKPEQVSAMLAEHNKVRESTSVEDLDEAQRRRHFLNDLMGSPMWDECVAMFEEEELALYKYKYVEFMMTFDTVTEVEKGSVHIMLSCLVRIDRYQKQEKEYRDMAKSGDASAGAKAITLHREIKDMVEIYLKAQDDLNASRKQRIKEEGDHRLNLIELVKELETREARDKLGREADAFKYIQDLEEDRLRDQGFIRGEKT
jgi:transcriptional regulator